MYGSICVQFLHICVVSVYFWAGTIAYLFPVDEVPQLGGRRLWQLSQDALQHRNRAGY